MPNEEHASTKNTKQSSNKKSFSLGQLLPFVIFLLLGGAGGTLMGRSLAGLSAEGSTLPEGLLLFLLVMLFFVSLFLQIIIHEAGHLVFGLLTGYRFSSFRIGSLMLLKEDGRLRLKTLSIAGTGGQCLLLPPTWSETHAPYVLYHLGGALMNFITAALFFVCNLAFANHALLSAVFGALAAAGAAIGLMNAIPLRMALLDNDGSNLLWLRKDPQAVFAFYRMLEIHGQIAAGKRLRDLPEDWFLLPATADLKNPLISTIQVYAINRLLDEQKVAQTAERIRALIGSSAAVNGIHRNLLRCDLAYCAMMQDDFVTAHETLDDPLRKFMQSMKTFPSILRTQYTEALLRDHDESKAAEIHARFDRIAKKYPYPSDIESENDLMRAAQAKSTLA